MSSDLTLTDFLLARIAEDEDVARAIYDHDRWVVEKDGNGDEWVTEVDRADQHWRVAMLSRDGLATHIARHDPARVLAECEAKRMFIDRLGAPDPHGADEDCLDCDLLYILASPYADHPDHRQEWKP